MAVWEAYQVREEWHRGDVWACILGGLVDWGREVKKRSIEGDVWAYWVGYSVEKKWQKRGVKGDLWAYWVGYLVEEVATQRRVEGDVWAYWVGYSVKEEWQKREELRGTCERTVLDWLPGWWRVAKNKKSQGGRVSVLGGLLGWGRVAKKRRVEGGRVSVLGGLLGLGRVAKKQWRGTCQHTQWDELSSEDEEIFLDVSTWHAIARSIHYACESNARVIGILSWM